MNAILPSEFPRLHDSEAGAFRAGRLRSLWDMLKENAADFMELGHAVRDVLVLFDWDKYFHIDQKTGTKRLAPSGVDVVQAELKKLVAIGERLNLPVSVNVISRYTKSKWIDDCPQTSRDMERLISIFEDELRSRKCLFIPSHLEVMFENDSIVSDEVLDVFPKASEELRNSGTALATGLFTASVFHAMRAAEIGLRSMHSAFPLTFKGNKSIEFAEWREVLDALSNVASGIENKPNSDSDKEPDLNFVSEASAQFRFFKNGWRVRVAHARYI
jgi:hypothetical protein